MLNLLAPIQLEGVSLFRDDANPVRFYALPDQPVVQTDDEGRPEFLFIKYLYDVEELAEGEELGGGYVQFRVALTIDDERRERIMEGLRDLLREEKLRGSQPFGLSIQSTEPILAAPTWTDGAVGLQTFEASEDGLVRKAATTGLPDLGADLGASVVLQLNPDGAEIFWTAFQSDALPVVLGYELTYVARLPAARMTVVAKYEELTETLWPKARPFQWNKLSRMYKRLPMPAGVQTLSKTVLGTLGTTHGAGVVAGVPSSKVKEVIRSTIEVTIESGDAGDADISTDLREQLTEVATSVVADSLVPALFGSSVTADLIEGDDDDEEVQLLKDEPDIEVDFRMVLEQDADVRRTVNPNGPVQLLLPEEFRQQAFRELRLADRFFSTARIQASAEGVDFEGDGIASIVVEIDYDHVDQVDPSRPRIRRGDAKKLTETTPAVYWRFDLARSEDGSHFRDFRWRTTVHYRENVRPSSNDWETTDLEVLTVNPSSLRALRVDLSLTAPSSEVSSARVELRYPVEAEAGTELFEAARELTQAEPEQSWFQYTGEKHDDVQHPEYAWRALWRTAEHGTITSDWTTSRDRLRLIGSPFEKRLVFDLMPQGFTSTVAAISGTLTYHDEARGYSIAETFSLEAVGASNRITFSILAGGAEAADISWRAVRHNDAPVEGVLESVPPGLVWVGPTSASALAIEVTPSLVDFETDVKLAVVRLRYTDADNGIDERKTLQFMAGSAEPTTWTVERVDESARTISYTIDYIHHDNRRTKEVVEAWEDSLVILDPSLAS